MSASTKTPAETPGPGPDLEAMAARIQELEAKLAAIPPDSAPPAPAKPTNPYDSTKYAPFVMEEGRHYVTVPKALPGQMDSPIGKYLAMRSPTRPGYAMYRFESDDPIVTGDERVVMISCLGDDYKARLTETHTKSQELVKSLAPAKPPEFNQEEGQTFEVIGHLPLGASGPSLSAIVEVGNIPAVPA